MSESLQIPACPHCGCKRSEVLDVRECFNMTTEYRQCANRHCRRHFRNSPTFTYDSDPVRCVCPNCREKNPAVTKSIQRRGPDGEEAGTIRYHKCQACSFTFKTLESAR